MLFNLVLVCAERGQSRNPGHPLLASGEIDVHGHARVLRHVCDVDVRGQDLGSAATTKAAGIGDPITGVDVIRAPGTCPDGSGSGSGSEKESVNGSGTAGIVTAHAVAGEFEAGAAAEIV